MADRVVRDDLLRSHRYRRLSSDTVRLLFVHLLLSADNYGNYEATTTAIEDAMRRPVEDTTAAKWLSELADSDLIRLYTIENKQFLHIPRFRQRIQFVTKPRHPRPPQNIDDIKNSDLPQKFRVRSDGTRMVHERREEKRSKEQQQPTTPPALASLGSAIAAVVKTLPPGFEAFWDAYPTTRKVARMECLKRWQTRGLEKISDRILAHLTLMKATKAWQEGFDPAPLTYINQRRWEDGQTQPVAEQRRVAL